MFYISVNVTFVFDTTLPFYYLSDENVYFGGHGDPTRPQADCWLSPQFP